jgi:hypothetical protein
LTDRRWREREACFHLLDQMLRNVGITRAADRLERASQALLCVRHVVSIVAFVKRGCLAQPTNGHAGLMNGRLIAIPEQRQLD